MRVAGLLCGNVGDERALERVARAPVLALDVVALVALDVAKCMAERMAANLAAAALFSEDRFTVLPPLTFKEAKECIERDPKRARLSLSD